MTLRWQQSQQASSHVPVGPSTHPPEQLHSPSMSQCFILHHKQETRIRGHLGKEVSSDQKRKGAEERRQHPEPPRAHKSPQQGESHWLLLSNRHMQRTGQNKELLEIKNPDRNKNGCIHGKKKLRKMPRQETNSNN